MFNNTGGLGYGNAVSVNPFGGMPESLKSLSHMMARMWISFVVNLDPNHIGIGRWIPSVMRMMLLLWICGY